MRVGLSFARAQDEILFDKVMAPFRDGRQDSTKIPGFAEEKKLASRQYSAKVATLLFETAKAFSKVLAPGAPAFLNALLWAERAGQLAPNEHTRVLLGGLRALTSFIRSKFS